MDVFYIPELVTAIVLAPTALSQSAVILCKIRQLCRFLAARYKTAVTPTCSRATNCSFGEYYFTAAAGPFGLKTAVTSEFRPYSHARAAAFTVCGDAVNGGDSGTGDLVITWQYPRAYEIAVTRTDFAALVHVFGVFAGKYGYSGAAMIDGPKYKLGYLVIPNGLADIHEYNERRTLFKRVFYHAGKLYHCPYCHLYNLNYKNLRLLRPFDCRAIVAEMFR